jgi:hypothetical protein
LLGKRGEVSRKQAYMDPFDKEFTAHIERIRAAGLKEDQRIELTCSSVPGTTLRVSKVKVPALGIKLYDTPGLTLETQHFAHVSEFRLLKGFAHHHQINPLGIHFEVEKTLWVGGVCRIDSFSVTSSETRGECHSFFRGQDLALPSGIPNRH